MHGIKTIQRINREYAEAQAIVKKFATPAPQKPAEAAPTKQ